MLRRLIGELCNRELRSWIDTITNPTSTIVRDLQVGQESSLCSKVLLLLLITVYFGYVKYEQSIFTEFKARTIKIY